MVNALYRRLPGTATESTIEAVNEVVSGIVLEQAIGEEIQYTMENDLLPFGDNKCPCALREFINSSADLPTIEELAKKSKTLAIAMGMPY